MTPEQIKHIREWLDGVPKQADWNSDAPRLDGRVHIMAPKDTNGVPGYFTDERYTITTVKPKVRVSVALLDGIFEVLMTSRDKKYTETRERYSSRNDFTGWLIDDQEVDMPGA